jgi:hypothetical protein
MIVQVFHNPTLPSLTNQIISYKHKHNIFRTTNTLNFSVSKMTSTFFLIYVCIIITYIPVALTLSSNEVC